MNSREIQGIIDNSSSMVNVLKELGYCETGGGYKVLKERINDFR